MNIDQVGVWCLMVPGVGTCVTRALLDNGHAHPDMLETPPTLLHWSRTHPLPCLVFLGGDLHWENSGESSASVTSLSDLVHT